MSTASQLGSAGAGVAAGALVGGPIGMGIGAGAGALINLIGSIGQGRKTANKLTGPGDLQDVLNQQLAQIDTAPGYTDMDRAQATAVAYQNFLQGAAQFAATQGPDAAKVVQQAVYKTPGLQSTLNTLLAPLGVTSTDPQFTQMIPGITATSDTSNYNGQSSNVLGSTLLGAGIGAGTSAGTSAIGSLLNGGNGNPLNSGGLLTGGIGSTDTSGGAPAGTQGGGAGGGGPVYDSNGNVISGAQLPAGSTGNQGLPGSATGTAAAGGIGGILQGILGKNPIGSLLGIGSTIAGGVLQSNAAQNAAQLQANAANNAAQLQATTAANNLNFAKQVYNTQQQQEAPFLAAGQNALGQAQQFIQNQQPFSYGSFQAPTPQALPGPFQAPTAEQAAQTPGYQFQLNEALKALGRQSQGVTSGATIKAAEQYANNLAASNYQQTYNNALQGYQTNYGNIAQQNQLGFQNALQGYQTNYGNALQQYQTNYQDQLNPLLSLAGYGPQAVGANAAVGTQTAQNTANVSQGAATQIGQLGQQAAASQAGGNILSTNALTSALNQIANNAALQQQLQQLSQSSG